MVDQTLGGANVLNVVPPAALEAMSASRAGEVGSGCRRQSRLHRSSSAISVASSRSSATTAIPQRLVKPPAGGAADLQRTVRRHQDAGGAKVRRLPDLCPADRAEVPGRLARLLRDIYLGSDRPWAIRPPADPDIPDEIIQKIDALLAQEQQMVMQTTGQQPRRRMCRSGGRLCSSSAAEAAKKKAREQAKIVRGPDRGVPARGRVLPRAGRVHRRSADLSVRLHQGADGQDHAGGELAARGRAADRRSRCPRWSGRGCRRSICGGPQG